MRYEQDKDVWHRATATFRNKSKVYSERFTEQEAAIAAEKKENQPLRDRVAQLEAELKESREQQLELTKALGANEEKLRLVTAKNSEYKEVARREN